MIRGTIESAERQGATVYIVGDATPSDHLDVAETSTTTVKGVRELDGYIFAFPNATFLRYAETLHRRGCPVMIIGRRVGDVPRVLCNNFEAVRGAVKNFVERGHREIAFVNGPAENLCAAERFRGYRQALEECGIQFDPTRVFEGDMSEQTSRDVVTKALREGVTFSAVIATNDLTAIGVMDALKDCGKTVPADAEVIGFDNVPRSHWSTPSLSTFDMQAYRLGYNAVERVLSVARGEKISTEALIETPFVERSSTRSDSSQKSFASEWAEGEFFCERQLERVLARPEGRQQRRRLAELDVASPEFAETFRAFLETATRAGVGASSLYSVLGDALARSQTGSFLAAAKVFETLSSAAVNEQKSELDMGVVFAAATLPLRELSFESVDEAVVIDGLRQTLRTLKIERAGLVLHHGESAAAFETDEGKWMNFSEQSPMRPFSSTELEALTKPESQPGAFVILPLNYRGVQFGQLFLDASTPFLIHFPDLMGQLAAALHGARMHSALARANRDLEASRVQAEIVNEQLAKSYETLKNTQRELFETSRLAGIAEMATGVLHNIGNVLNSVNTSATVAADIARNSKVSALMRVVEMLEQNREHLAEFLTKDPRGSVVIDYLKRLAGILNSEQAESLKEFDTLREKIDHLNQIVAAQQSYANVASISETIEPAELIEHAVRLSDAALSRHRVSVRREIARTAAVRVPRQRALQVLVNLITNAKEAVNQRVPGDREILLDVRDGGPGRVTISVADNGAGIAPENLTRIFAFGFTTKKNGHGFGLHSSALAAKEMQGALRAESAGVGKGATFVLELPAAV